MQKRVLSALLALCIMLSLLPGTALAAQPQALPAAVSTVSSSPAARAQTATTWRFLFVILKKNNIPYPDETGKTQRETNTMTSAEVQAIRSACNNFKTYFTQNAGTLVKPVVEILEINTPITELVATGVSGSEEKNPSLWLPWDKCLPLIRSKVDINKYDHITAIANLNNIKTPVYWGLTGSGFPQGTGYSFINTQNKDYCLRTFSTTSAFQSSVFVHEFLHYAHSWSIARTGKTPTVNNHQAAQYGYDNNNHSKFYADLINKRVVDSTGNLTGIEPAAWANPPVKVRSGRTSYTVTFHGNGGSVPAASKTKIVTNGQTYGTLPQATRTGYNLAGWYTGYSNNSGVQVKATDKVSLTSDQTLYARWTPKAGSNVYTVTLDYNGAVTSTKPETRTVTYGQTYGTLPEPIREGYTFAGWYTAKTGGSKVTSTTKATTQKNHTLYAHWTKKRTITVTMNPNGGEFVSGTPKITLIYGEPYNGLLTPVREGYTFAGWYTAKSGGKQITAETTVTTTSNQTLYARWVKGRTFQVNFDPNGGIVMQDSIRVIHSSSYRDLPTPSRADYHFAGWYTAKTGGRRITPTTKVEIFSTQTLYARWTKEPVAVQKRQSGSWSVSIPVGCKMYTYANETDAKVSGGLPAWPWTYSCTCNKKVELSNGVVRYYSVNYKSWITYTMEMDVE